MTLPAHCCPRCARPHMTANGITEPHTRPTERTPAHPTGWRPCAAPTRHKLGGVVRLTRADGSGPYRGGGSTDGGAA